MYIVSDEAAAILSIWRRWRGGMGPGLPPFSGTAEQPACVMASLEIMESAAAALKPKPTEQE